MADPKVDDFPELSAAELAEIQQRQQRRHGAPGTGRAADDRAARQQHDFQEAERAELRDRQRSGRMVTSSDGAGFVLGLVGWALVLAYFRGGTPAVRGWIAAKFLNKPYTGELSSLTPTGRLRPDFGAGPVARPRGGR